jgi:hypothetical protein
VLDEHNRCTGLVGALEQVIDPIDNARDVRAADDHRLLHVDHEQRRPSLGAWHGNILAYAVADL